MGHTERAVQDMDGMGTPMQDGRRGKTRSENARSARLARRSRALSDLSKLLGRGAGQASYPAFISLALV